MYFNKVYPYEDAENIYSKIGKNESLMSETDHGFLCGLLEKYKPHRILEVGVYAGGTTVAVLDMLQRLGLSSEVYSVDLAEYIEQDRPVGYIVEESQAFLHNLDKFHLYTGVAVPEIIEEIAGDKKFDLAIIDTTHYLPGEILDFLACYPYMESGGIVVLHDVMLNQKDRHRAAATKVVFDIVVGEKMWNWDMEKYPNIAAIKLNEDTGKYIKSLISALSLSWYYDPGAELLDKYRNVIKRNYDEEALSVFDKMTAQNVQWWKESTECIQKMINEITKSLLLNPESRLFIYGAGKMGRMCFRYLKENSLSDRVSGYIVSDDQNLSDKEADGIQIYRLSEVDYIKEQDIVINSIESQVVEEMLNDRGIEFIKLSGIVKEALMMRLNT